MTVRIIGCGNPDRGDDAAGLLVAARLREMGIAAEEQTGEALALMDRWDGAEEVIVADAVSSGKSAGEITVWDARSKPRWFAPGRGSTHQFGVAEAVELARALDRLPRRLRIYGIEGKNFEPGSGPSAEVMEAVEKVAEQIASEVGNSPRRTQRAQREEG